MTSHTTTHRITQVRLPGLPDSYPAHVDHQHEPPVVRLAWTTLVRLADDLIRHWPHRAATDGLAPLINLHHGGAYLIGRFGDRDSPVYPLLPDADGLYPLDDPSLPWIVAPSAPAPR
ncbi:hypothetical protein [Polymorphospora sp. NPDC050346]|uniref:hypothetical protein n=1 Tax=Polymorphospora sp. NPDC050346 TaxID=3155780 RepID=UPI0033CE8FED